MSKQQTELQQLADAIDQMVSAGDIIAAFDRFAADHCITHSNPNDKTHSKGQKMEALRWFFSNIERINQIERRAVAIGGDHETHSEFVFDFLNKQGQNLTYNEIIRRVWENGKLVEEEYLFGQTIPAPASKPAKTAAPKATAAKEKAAPKAAAPVKTAVAKEKAAPATKEKAAAKKTKAVADDLTIVEGIGPKIAELLQKAGIGTFAALASAKPEAIKAVLDAAGKRYQMHDPATWPKQAALARDGKSEALAQLQQQLKGGK